MYGDDSRTQGCELIQEMYPKESRKKAEVQYEQTEEQEDQTPLQSISTTVGTDRIIQNQEQKGIQLAIWLSYRENSE